MRPEDVAKILEVVNIADNKQKVEVTLEANPSDIVKDRGKLEGFVNAGVNRISLGIQVIKEGSFKGQRDFEINR